jgi:signal transduction histidine kinase
MFRFLARQPKAVRFVEVLLLVAATGCANFLAGPMVSIGLFYCLPILFAVKFCGRKSAYIITALVWLTWIAIDFINRHHYLGTLHQAWQFDMQGSFFFLVAFAGMAVRDRAVASAQRLESLEFERRINQITEYEQQRVGRELHDGLCQYLAAVSCGITALKQDLEQRGVADLATKTQAIERLLTQAVAQGRDLSRSLSPVPDEASDLASALQALSAATARRFGIECTFKSSGENRTTKNGNTTNLYRIAQEAIDNAAMHGKAKSIQLRMSANPQAISLSVSDDGIGMPAGEKQFRGDGIGVMRYRAGSAGGELQIESRKEGGTVVSCTVPLPQTA